MALKFSFRTFQQLKAVLRPACFCIILALSCFMISELCLMIKKTKNHVMEESYAAHEKSFGEIERTVGLLSFLNSSASNLARTLSAYLNATQLSYSDIETKVAPILFLSLTTIPHLSQVSYIGNDGLMFSYYNDKQETVAVYSNSSLSSSWNIKPVNRDNGKLYGTAVSSKSLSKVNSSWFQQISNNVTGCSSIGTGLNEDQDSLFLNSVAMDGRGVISLGFPIKIVIDHFEAIDFHGGYFHLATAKGQVIVEGKLGDNTRIDVSNSSVTVLNTKGNIMHKDDLYCSNEKNSRPLGRTVGNKYTFYCSTIVLAGVQSVYVLAYPKNELASLVRRNSELSVILLALVFVFVVISLCIYIFLTARATKREMFLCAALIKQMDATQQAERKSMNKTKAYAGANHDVRGSLAAITGLIELCQENATPGSELATNLVQMKKCTDDLLGILNSILDMSKIEAGKASLEKEDFNLAQLLEEVVDMYYLLAMKKGVDVVLDPCDGSILKLPLVKGDRIKLKQILCNLLNNAIKFTSEGHISVRAVVKKNNLKKEIIASNRTTTLKLLSFFCPPNEDSFTDLDALHEVEENPNEMEVEFEVDDTGKGIPRDKQKSIFEDYVQVKETTIGQEGCGLGLGIVQSLVRVMKGELRIVEKEYGERGTCFRFNVFLSTCEPESSETAENRLSAFHQHFTFISPKPEGSHVIMFISGEERRKVLKRFIESLNIKVTIIKSGRHFRRELEKIKRKLDLTYFSSGKHEAILLSDYLSTSASSNSDAGGASNNKLQSMKDGADHILPQYKKTNSKNSFGILLFLMDNAAANFAELDYTLAAFRRDIPKLSCKFVWLDDQIIRQSKYREHHQEKRNLEGEYVIYKPFHGSRLIQVLSLLPEHKGTFPELRNSADLTEKNSTMMELDLFTPLQSHPSTSQPSTSQQVVMMQEPEVKQKGNKPLNGKKILVVEDGELLRRIVTSSLRKLGANVEVCTNGEEAVNQVCKALRDQKKEADLKCFDYIFMDCEMPVMDGYEATRLIRKEEKDYDVHIPVIALSAHAMPEEASKSIDAGMDFHLTKPLQVDKLLDVIRSIDKQ